jgi:hypothetical protein
MSAGSVFLRKFLIGMSGIVSVSPRRRRPKWENYHPVADVLSGSCQTVVKSLIVTMTD